MKSLLITAVFDCSFGEFSKLIFGTGGFQYLPTFGLDLAPLGTESQACSAQDSTLAVAPFFFPISTFFPTDFGKVRLCKSFK